MEIHHRGYMWRYVRASMSLSGYLPPLCDEGNMLLDGGYLNNLPADIVISKGAHTVIAVDVGSEVNISPATYGDALSGWYALLMSVLPFTKKMRIPTLADIQSQLAYVSCVKQLEEVKQMENCIYLRPPVAQFGTMEFNKFEEIYEAGYRYGKEIIREWRLKGMLNAWQPKFVKPAAKHGRRNSF
jgi:lysophospholipid hydrolase